MDKCQICGLDIPAGKQYCPLCETKIAEAGLESKIIEQNPTATLSIQIPVDEEYLHRFSWGAAATGIIYLLAMGVRSTYTIIWIVIILSGSFTFGLSSIAAFVWLGLSGRKLAWQAKNWPSFDNFQQIQNRWDHYGKITLIVELVLFLVIIFVGFSLVGPNLPSLKEINELTSELQ